MENSFILLGKSPKLVERTGGLSELTLVSRPIDRAADGTTTNIMERPIYTPFSSQFKEIY
jgi:hypothetical protein